MAKSKPKLLSLIFTRDNKLATVIGFNKDADTQVKKDIAMQAAAMAPIAVDKNDVPQEVIAHELEIGRDKAREEGKPGKHAR